jgi:hypothetical protein
MLRQQADPVTVPALATAEALASLHTEVGAKLTIPLWGSKTDVRIVGQLTALSGDVDPAALLLDMPALSTQLQQTGWRPPNVTEWWVQTDPAAHANLRPPAIPEEDVWHLYNADIAEVSDETATIPTLLTEDCEPS